MRRFSRIVLKINDNLDRRPVDGKREPTARVELATFRLRSDCSTTKLCWLGLNANPHL